MRVLEELAKDGGRLKGQALAERVESTPGFVSQVVTPLVKERWVASDPGPSGGYSLQTDLDEISLLAVIEAVEGATDTKRCVLADRECDEAVPCALHESWRRARALLMSELDRISVAEAASRRGSPNAF